MTGLEQIKQVYFLGIGGIGMSALARWFARHGYATSGYDRVESELTRELAGEGIQVHYDDRGAAVGEYLKKENTLVVLTPAVPADMGERVFLEKAGFTLKKRSEVLGMICKGFRTCAVAGTHGKTTVSTMLAHIFYTSPFGCTAFLGGISGNYQTNLLLSDSAEWVVVEADEFDRSFLQLFPDLAVVTSMDADHLDIYGDHRAVVEAFHAFLGQVRPQGKAVVKKGLPVERTNRGIDYYIYALDEQADFYAEKIKLREEACFFDLVYTGGRLDNLVLNYPGLLNVENAVAASSLALLGGIAPDVIRQALATYKGVKRRFDIRYRGKRYILIDDYAHHPQELRAFIRSVKETFKGWRVTGIFQPHLYSRTNDFYGEFAEQLSELDEVVLLDIYPAREQPIAGVTSALIYDRVNVKDKLLLTRWELPAAVRRLKPGIVLMMGAGDIDRMVEPVADIIKEMDHV